MKHISIFVAVFCFCFVASAQNFSLSGTVVDQDQNIPLLGATVLVKGTQNGVTTDFDGNFKIDEVSVNDILVVSYVGFVNSETRITSQNNVTISLTPDVDSLEEVLIVGYGTQRKKEITGAVSVISSETIEDLKPTRIEQALQGQVAGVQITPSSGAPGSGLDIKIRGIATNGDSRPLILLDGNVIEDLSVVNPSDIESINVLKDATAGIYGVRAANGVILITTKSGSYDSEIKFDFKSYYGIQETTRKIPVLNATEYAGLVNEARINNGEAPLFNNVGSLGQGTNWQNEVFESAPISNADITVSGGTENGRTSFSASYLTQDGIVGGDKANFNRFTSRLSHDRKILKKIEFNSSLLFSGIERKSLSENSLGSVLYNALNNAPTFTVRDQAGNYTLAEGLGNEVINPLAQMENTNNKTRVRKLSGSFSANYKFLEHFKIESRIQANYAEVFGFSYTPVAFYGSGKVFNISPDRDILSESANIFRDYTFDSFINYNNTFKDAHKLDVTLGTSIFQTTGRFTGFTGINIPGTDPSVVSMEDAEIVTDNFQNGGNTFDARLLSYFARVQYDYKGKYLFSGVMRRDGSTKFGPANKFGYFPSASAGWILSEESFLNDSNTFDFLKIRTSYGILGNDRIRDFGFESILNGEGAYVFDEELLFGTAIGGLSNPEIRWEKQYTFDVGLDAKFFDNKLDVSIDYFNRRTDDLLITPQTSGILGGSAPGSGAPTVNAGSVQNTGLELSLSYRNTVSEDFKYNFSINATALDNEVLEVNGEASFLQGGSFGVGQEAPARMEAGLPIGYFRGYQTDGVFQTQAEVDAHALQSNAQPGDLRFRDTNGDGVITTDDKTYLGDPIADATFGLNLGFTYKNFDFLAYVFSSVGNEIVRNYERFQPLTNRSTIYLDRWTGPGTSNDTPRVTTGATQNNQFSDFFVEDGSFVRLQNVQVGYTLSDSFLEDYKINELRFYVSASNLVTLTKYTGYDPTGSTGQPIGGGIDYGFYPTPKTYLFGLQLKF